MTSSTHGWSSRERNPNDESGRQGSWTQDWTIMEAGEGGASSPGRSSHTSHVSLASMRDAIFSRILGPQLISLPTVKVSD